MTGLRNWGFDGMTSTPVIPRTIAPTPKAEVNSVKSLSESIKHGFYGRKKPFSQFSKQDFKEALEEEITQRKEAIRKAFLTVGINAEPTPDNLILAYVKYGDKIVQALNEIAPIGGFEGQKIAKIVEANPLAAFNLVHSNDYKDDAEFYANLSASGGKPKAPETNTKDWWQTFDWGGVLKGGASVLTAVKGGKGSTATTSSGTGSTSKESSSLSNNKTLVFGVIGLVVLGIILYFVSKN